MSRPVFGLATLLVLAAAASVRAQDSPPPANLLGDFKADQIAAGRAIFYRIGANGCTYCHGPYAAGDTGPTIRGADEGMIRGAVDGVDKMAPQKRLLRVGDFAAVGAYLNWLGTVRLTEVVLRRGSFEPASVNVRPGAAIQFAVENAGLTAQTIASEAVGLLMTVPARGRLSTYFAAPMAEGSYELKCAECQGAGTFTVVVDAAAPEFVNPPPGTPVKSEAAN